MSLLQAIILGIIQGITEPLPISSSGHLEIFQAIFDIENTDLTYEIFLNFGSLIAIVILYRSKLAKIFGNAFKYVSKRDNEYKSDFKYFYLVFFASIPAAVVGVLLGDKIEELFTNSLTTGIMLIITGIFLYIIKNFDGNKDIDDMTIFDALFIGVAQSVALIPGISRSGSTIVGSMFRNLKRSVAFDFSFLMYIPVSLGVFASKINDITLDDNSYKYLIGTIIAGILTFFATKLLRKIVVDGKLVYFSYYCITVGLLAIFLLR